MQSDHDGKSKVTSRETLASLAAFLDNDPRQMEDEELDSFLVEAGIDFNSFNARLSSDMEAAAKKSRLVQAKESRKGFVERAKQVYDLASMTLEEKRSEIQQRLGLLGGKTAAVFNRNYENVDDEEDIDGLLQSLRELDERAE